MDIEDMDDNLELTSSGSTDTLDVTTGQPDGGTDQTAISSNATDDNDDGLLGVVRDVVKDRATPDAAASSADGGEGGAVGADGKPSTTAPDNDKYSDVPFHKHPRFQELITERNTFKEDATRYQNVAKYLDENNLSSEDAANALSTFARAKIDPAGAFAELKPWLQDLLVRAGEVLPDDLRARVEKGELTQDTASEISRERAKVNSHESRQSFEQQRTQRNAETQHVTALVTTAKAWEDDRLAKDPNFKAKQPALMREVAFLQLQEGKPKNVEGVKDQLKRAYDAINKAFVPPTAITPAPKKPAIKPVTGGQVTGTVREEPKSTLDIIRANRRPAAG